MAISAFPRLSRTATFFDVPLSRLTRSDELRRYRAVVAAVVILGMLTGCSGSEPDIVTLSVPTPSSSSVEGDDAVTDVDGTGPGVGNADDASAEAGDDDDALDSTRDDFVSAAMEAAQAPAPSGESEPGVQADATASPSVTSSGSNPSVAPSITAAAEPSSAPAPTADLASRAPSACSDGFERVYEAFARSSPQIGIALCVSPDGRAEYIGLDVETNNRIRLSACVDGGKFVANNGGSLYIVDIATDSISYPQDPQGRQLDQVTYITGAATIPVLSC